MKKGNEKQYGLEIEIMMPVGEASGASPKFMVKLIEKGRKFFLSVMVK
jgi:hypothetical protein